MLLLIAASFQFFTSPFTSTWRSDAVISPALWHSHMHISLGLLIPTQPEEAEKMFLYELGDAKGSTRLSGVVRLITRSGTGSVVNAENQDSQCLHSVL